MQSRLSALLPAVFAIALAWSLPSTAAPQTGIEPAELRRIELLIEVVARSTDHSFIRNGTSYDAATAARFLRLKWDYAHDRVHSAEDFIREIASQSGTTGSPYRVRSADGREEDSAAFLNRVLAGESRIATK